MAFLVKGLTDAATRNAAVDQLDAVANELNCSLAQLAIAWVARNPRVSSVILGASKLAQLQDNLGALAVVDQLTPGGAGTHRRHHGAAGRVYRTRPCRGRIDRGFCAFGRSPFAFGRKGRANGDSGAYSTFHQRHVGVIEGVCTMIKTTTHIAAFVAAAIMTVATQGTMLWQFDRVAKHDTLALASQASASRRQARHRDHHRTSRLKP